MKEEELDPTTLFQRRIEEAKRAAENKDSGKVKNEDEVKVKGKQSK